MNPNSAFIGIVSKGGLKNRSMRLRGTDAEAFSSFCLMLPAMLIGAQHWTQKVPKL